MKCLVLALLLWSSVAFATEAPVPNKLIYQDYDVADGTVYSVKATNKKNMYYWYVETDRCLAILKSKIITMECDNSPGSIVLKQQGTDVVMTLNSESRAAMEGTLVHGMYWAIVKHSAKK